MQIPLLDSTGFLVLSRALTSCSLFFQRYIFRLRSDWQAFFCEGLAFQIRKSCEIN